MIDFLIHAEGPEPGFSIAFNSLLAPVKERIPVEPYLLWQQVLADEQTYSHDVPGWGAAQAQPQPVYANDGMALPPRESNGLAAASGPAGSFYKKAQEYKRFVEGLKTLHAAARQYLPPVLSGPPADRAWPEAVLYLSLHLLFKKISDDGLNWVDGLPGIPRGNINPDKLVLEKISALYGCWEKEEAPGQPSARPYAFYLLVKTALSDNDLRREAAAFGVLADYLLWMESKDGGRLKNRLTRFAGEYFSHEGILGYADANHSSAIDHFLKVDRREVALHAGDRKINFLMVGLPGNGKTTFIKELYHSIQANYNVDNPLVQLDVVAIPEAIQGETEVILKPGKTVPTMADHWELTGKFKVGTASGLHDISFNDTRGEVIGEVPPIYRPGENGLANLRPLEEKLLSTDLLLIVIDPALLFAATPEMLRRLFGNVTARLDYLFHRSKHAMFAIVFSKFDEYGVVLSGPRNLISNKEQGEKLLHYAKYPTEANWAAFVEAVLEKYGARHDPLPLVIKALLDKVEPLFTTICSHRDHPVLNAYMVSIPKPSANARLFKRTGIPVIFEDFGRYYRFLVNSNQRIEPPLPPAPANVQVTPRPDEEHFSSLEIFWDRPAGFEGKFTVERQLRGRNGIIAEEWLPLTCTTDTRFVDRDLRRRRYHKYRVLAVAHNKASESVEKPEVYRRGQPVNLPVLIALVLIGLALIGVVYLLNHI